MFDDRPDYAKRLQQALYVRFAHFVVDRLCALCTYCSHKQRAPAQGEQRMAAYWDYRNAGTGYWDNGTAATTTITGNGGVWGTSTSTTTNYYYVPIVYRREMLIEHPAHWTEADAADFTRLVNDETSTGWKVKMLISGGVKIADTNIDQRSMADFVPLFKDRANAADRATIDKFFAAHPLVAPEAGA